MRTPHDLLLRLYANKMDRLNQPWYSTFGVDFGLSDGNEGADGVLSSSIDRSMDPGLSAANMPNKQSSTTLLASQLDISTRIPNGDTWSVSPYQARFHGDDLEWYSILDNERSQAAANTPYSFYNRMLQTTMPHSQLAMKAISGETYPEDLLNSHRADSGVGILEDVVDFNGPTHDPQWVFDQASYDRHFEDDYFRADHSKENDDESQNAGSLQYHLIKTESRTNVRNIPSDEAKKAEVCPFCPNKQYTGAWAHRNLTRHMETAHAPCASSGGMKQIRCGFHGCDRTFRREDARLVHERRSHPELNRPPAAKRKRSDDL